MTNLERRDRRRAMGVIKAMNAEPDLTVVKVRDLIAKALKRERMETSMAAAQWFLFSGKNEKAKVKRVLSKPGAKASFGAEQKKGKR